VFLWHEECSIEPESRILNTEAPRSGSAEYQGVHPVLGALLDCPRAAGGLETLRETATFLVGQFLEEDPE